MTDGSITHWIGQVIEGGEATAEQKLWDQYFSRLVALANQKLLDLPPHLRDEEDVALSAMNSFFTRAKQDGFSRLHDRTDLWQLLAKITVRKAVHRRRKTNARKRGGGSSTRNAEFAQDVQNLAAKEPTPDMLAAINEECQRLMSALDDGLRPVARMKLEGYTNREIAEQLGRVERTVERKLERIRTAWINEVNQS